MIKALKLRTEGIFTKIKGIYKKPTTRWPARPLEMAVCMAVIAEENYPLYIRNVPTENKPKFHYTVHTSLEVVDEKISAMGKALVDPRELYLGLLYPTEDYKVYGYMTN